MCSLANQGIQINLFGPNKMSDMGNKYELTMTDAFTKCAEIFAIPNKKAKTVIQIWFSQNEYVNYPHIWRISIVT
jgi:hypothetical protein